MKVMSRGIGYHVEMKGQGNPLLLLHGFTGSSANWDDPSSYLPVDLQLIKLDIIGHGQSDSPDDSDRYQMGEVVADIAAILDTLQIKKLAVLGYSMGGRLALSFAAAYPERVIALILESASPGLKTEVERTERRQSDYKLAKSIKENGLPSFVKYWSGIPLFQTQRDILSKEKIHLIEKQRLTNSELGLSNSLIGMGTGSQPSLWGKLGTMNFPVLLMTGGLDKKFSLIAKEMSEMLPQSEWKKIRAAGHAIHVEQPEKFGKIVSDFLLKINWRVKNDKRMDLGT